LSEFESDIHKGTKVMCCPSVGMSTFKGYATVWTWVGVSKSHIEQHGILDGVLKLLGSPLRTSRF